MSLPLPPPSPLRNNDFDLYDGIEAILSDEECKMLNVDEDYSSTTACYSINKRI
jgi:hypothetical protein